MDSVATIESNKPRLTYCPHPLLAGADRKFYRVEFVPGETIQKYLDRLDINTSNRPWVLQLNGHVVPREKWSDIQLKKEDMLTLRASVQGGDSDDENKTIRTILTIVVLVVAQQYTGVAQVAIAAIGSYAAAALFPPVFPELTDVQNEDDASPTYALAGGSNRARPFKPMPCVLGQHRIFPDYGALPYTEFVGKDQYLYQVFHFGLTDIALSDYRIGETPLTSFNDYEIEEAGADGALDLFPTNVNAIQGTTLNEAAGWVVRTSDINATALDIEFTGYLFRSGEDGMEILTVDIGAEYRKVGDATWLPFTADATGVYTLVHSSRKPLRYGFRKVVTSGQYEVRCQRITPDETDNRNTSQIEWAQLRTYQPDTANYSGQNRVALRIRASEQLHGQIDRLSALASLSCEVWNGSAWVNQATSNPAWLYRYWAKGKFTGTRRIFGGGLTDADLDIEAIKEWGAWCDNKSLTCNLVFDQDRSVEQQLTLIARCGRARPSRGSGKLGIVWDQDNQLPVAHFGMSNIRRGSFKVSYARARQFDEVAVNFVNPDLNWQADTVRTLVPGVTDPVNTLNVEIMGCTDPAMAGREANLVAAETIYRRRSITWETDIEGLSVIRGDVVVLTHDLTQWGSSGRLRAGTNDTLLLDRKVSFSVGFDAYLRLVYPDGTEDLFKVVYSATETDTITLQTKIVKDAWQASSAQVVDDEVIPVVANGFYYVCTVAGTTGASEPTWPTVEGDTVVDGTVTWQNSGPAQQYYPDNHPTYKPIDYKFCFDPKATPGKLVKLVDVQPLDEHHVRLTATDEDENYYLSESNSYTYIATTPADLTPSIVNLEVSDTLINVGNSYGVRLTMDWDTDGPYSFAIVRAAPNGEPLEIVDRTFDHKSEILWPSFIGSIDIEVTVFNAEGGYGDLGRQSTTYTMQGQDRDPDDVTNFRIEIDNNGPVLRWNDVNAADLLDYEIREGTVWDTATFVGRVDSNEFPLSWLSTGSHNFLIKARDASSPRNYSTNAASLAAVIGPALAPNVSSSFEGENLVLNYSATAGSLPIAEYEISYGANAGDNIVGRVAADRFRIRANWIGSRTWWVTPIDVGGSPGASGSIDVVVMAPTLDTLDRDIIQNQVALNWSSTPGTLPIAEYRVYKGDVFASSELLGTITGTFNVIAELTAGTYTYWVVPVDVAGNAGTEVSTVASVSSPPGFILREDWASTFTGIKTNAFITQAGTLLMPVNTTETWSDHFVNNAWADPDDQIVAGFNYYAMPSETTASYEEEFDYGSILEGTLISVVKNLVTLAGSVTSSVTISYKRLIGDAWTDTVADQVFATDFQFVKVKIDVTAADGDDLVELKQLNVQLSVSQIDDAGSGTAVSTDPSGTFIAFNESFVAAESIGITPKGSAPRSSTYTIPAGPNPTGFYVFLWDENGTRQSGDFTWRARGN